MIFLIKIGMIAIKINDIITYLLKISCVEFIFDIWVPAFINKAVPKSIPSCETQ